MNGAPTSPFACQRLAEICLCQESLITEVSPLLSSENYVVF